MKTPSFESNTNNFYYHFQNNTPNPQYSQFYSQEISYLSKRIKDLEIDLQAAKTSYDQMKE